MQTGKAAGMYTVGVLWGYREKTELQENGADAFAHTPEEILTLYEKYNDTSVKRSESRSCLHDKAFELGTRQI